MAHSQHALEVACQRILQRIGSRAAADNPFLVGLDGGSGSGKSSLARLLRERAGAAVVPSDDFFAARITAAGWAARSPAERAADCIDWRRLRSAALEPLLLGETAEWYPFDFARGTLPDGTYAFSADAVRLDPAALIVVDGAYSCRPELSDLIDLRVLVDALVSVRHDRIAQREDPDFLREWHDRWDAAEAYYFQHVSPRDGFDLVIENA